MTKTLAAAFAAAVLTMTSACGGGGDRPSVDEVSASLQSEDSLIGSAVPEGAADCIAQALTDSGLSDESLRALVEGDEDYEGSEDEEDVLSGLSADVAECAADIEQ